MSCVNSRRTLRLSFESAVAHFSPHGCVLSADSFEDGAGFLIGKGTRQISAQSMYARALRDLVPQVFELNRLLRIAFGQQGGRNFYTNHNPTIVSLYSLGCSQNEI